MLQNTRKFTTTWINSIGQVDAEAWNTLAKPLATPFFHWQWLSNIESSGCAVPKEGWLPNHLLVWDQDVLVAAAPLYLKGHSYGEFVFDHEWARLSYRLGIEYYPKLLGMSPFTPAVGYRFLIHPDLNDRISEYQALTDLIVAEIDRFCDRNNISGCHFLFVDPQWRTELEHRGFSSWMHHSYTWSNHNFSDFDHFLASFDSNQRRNIKKERKGVSKAGIEMQVFAGDQIPHHYFSFMYDLYSDTCDKFWGGSKYLNRRFFESLYHNFKEHIVFVVGIKEDWPKPVGMSFCIRKGDRLYGRYWGSTQDVKFLHFNACYYTPIDWAISQGINLFDPGAGGQHKKRRGFPATSNYSLHRFYNPRLKQILLPHIQEVNEYKRWEIDAINGELPFDLPEPTLDKENKED
ncbi:protein of unknown function DUF482 [Thalassoporum mexicanum PCC 7367]|uniref:GNAT family N-acetyltransferase n=1 Tax=Thalassoporum mexicanum TaxID=3457544 RepID=UPI00029FF392|nr:GNAT family N-acetyltransferase [Pseudanabaena sp. PCC 7367]AFY71735.1 protein of unknown function DUF482 [Pseudanabaena sp. PCC 7367]